MEERLADPATDKSSGHPEQHGDDASARVPTRHEQLGDGACDETKHDPTDDARGQLPSVAVDSLVLDHGVNSTPGRVYHGTDDDAFVLAVRMKHCPRTAPDPVRSDCGGSTNHPVSSPVVRPHDRHIVGLSAGTVAKARQRSTAQNSQSTTRLGKDGRVRPVNHAAGRAKVAALLAGNPTSPNRDRATGRSVVLHRARRAAAPARQPAPDPRPRQRPSATGNAPAHRRLPKPSPRHCPRPDISRSCRHRGRLGRPQKRPLTGRGHRQIPRPVFGSLPGGDTLGQQDHRKGSPAPHQLRSTASPRIRTSHGSTPQHSLNNVLPRPPYNHCSSPQTPILLTAPPHILQVSRCAGLPRGTHLLFRIRTGQPGTAVLHRS
jgi:hypothetical protein